MSNNKSDGKELNPIKSAKRKTKLPDLFDEVWQIYYADNTNDSAETGDRSQ